MKPHFGIHCLLMIVGLAPAAIATMVTNTKSPLCELSTETMTTGGRAVRLTMAPGQEVYFLFAPHLDPALQGELQNRIFDDGPLKTGTASLSVFAREVLKSQKLVLEIKKIELKTVGELAHTKKLSWLAVELPDSELTEFRKDLVGQRLSLNRRLRAAGLNAVEARDVTLLLYDSVHFWLSDEAYRKDQFLWIGIEDEKRHTAALKSAQKIEHLKSALTEYDRKISTLGPERLQLLQDEIALILGEKRRLERSSEKKVASRFPSAETQSMATQQMTAARNLVQASMQRDEAIAERLLNIPASGLITMGQAHEISLLERTIEKCRKRRDISRE